VAVAERQVDQIRASTRPQQEARDTGAVERRAEQSGGAGEVRAGESQSRQLQGTTQPRIGPEGSITEVADRSGQASEWLKFGVAKDRSRQEPRRPAGSMTGSMAQTWAASSVVPWAGLMVASWVMSLVDAMAGLLTG